MENGNWTETENFISSKKVDLTHLAGDSGSILHVAAMAGHANIVRELIRRPEGEELLKQKDRDGFTALARVARLTGNMEVARCMVEDSAGAGVGTNLLGIRNNDDDEIPLLLAADKGHTEITRFLYEKTPTDVLSERDLVSLLERCIKAEIFG